MEDKNQKDINLMPEDLRSKENTLSSKKKSSDFDFDLVLPEGQVKSSSHKGGISFWKKLGSIFKKPDSYFAPSKPSKEHQNKHHEEKKHQHKHEDKSSQTPQEVKSEFHVPSELVKSDLKVDYSNKSPESPEVKLEKKSTKDDKPHKKDGPSFWDKIKKLFAGKNKGPNIERVEEKEIVPHEMKMPEPKKEENPKESELKVEKIEDKLPEEPKKEEPKIDELPDRPSIKIQPQPTSSASQKSDFIIPELRPSEKKEEPQTKEPKMEDNKEEDKNSGKFHQPQPRIRARFLDDGGGVDLIPTAAKTRSWKQISKLLLVALIGSVIIVGGFYGYLFFRAKSIEGQKNTKIDQITDLEQQILNYESLNKDISGLGDQIRYMHFLLSFHFYWSNFFDMLEKYTIPEVHYQGLSAGNSGALTLHAVADNFDSVAKQIKVLEQENAKEFVMATDVSGASYSESDDSVTFDITLVLNPRLFVYDSHYMDQANNSQGN